MYLALELGPVLTAAPGGRLPATGPPPAGLTIRPGVRVTLRAVGLRAVRPSHTAWCDLGLLRLGDRPHVGGLHTTSVGAHRLDDVILGDVTHCQLEQQPVYVVHHAVDVDRGVAVPGHPAGTAPRP